MSLRQSHQPAVESKKKKEGSSGKYAFLLSAFFHGGLLLLIGGIVLIPAVVQKAAFTSNSSMIVPTESSMEAPPDSSNIQNELPNSEVPQETIALPDRVDPVAPTDIVVARQDSSMASSSWASSVNTSRPVSAKLPNFNQNDNQPQNQQDSNPEKKVALESTKMTLFGSTDQEDPNGIQGSFYDLKRFKGGMNSGLDLGPESFGNLIRQFTDHQWDEKFLKKYWSAKNTVFLHHLLVESMSADEAPKVFAVKCEPKGWVIHYKGYVTPAKTGTYRFHGYADDLILVRLNNKIVLDGSIGVGNADPSVLGARDRSGKFFDFNKVYSSWPEDKKIAEKSGHGVAGDWVNMTAGTPYPIEILVGERPGGKFIAFLLVEQKGQSENLPGFFSTDATVRAADIPKGIVHSGKPVYFKVVSAPSKLAP